MENSTIHLEQIKKALLTAWSYNSSSKWSKSNPAKGQCGVTSLVVNDIVGGEIRKTKLPDGWHYYNFINNKRFDLTASQFNVDILYSDTPSNREEAFTDTNEKQYSYLKQKVLYELFN